MNMDEGVFKHRVAVQMRFTDMDPLGHVGNVSYQEYFELAATEYFSDVVRPGDMTGDITYVVATLRLDFRKAIRYSKDVVAEIRVSRLGRKSFDFEGRLVNGATGDVYALCRSTQVCFDLSKDVSIPIPETWRDKILAYETTPPDLR